MFKDPELRDLVAIAIAVVVIGISLSLVGLSLREIAIPLANI